MNLAKLTNENYEIATNILRDYWKNRGMPEYDKTWALDYLQQGHKNETKNDEFFVYQEQEIIGMVSLITDVSLVAQIRDLVVKPEFRGKGYGKKNFAGTNHSSNGAQAKKNLCTYNDDYENFYISCGFEKEGLLKSHFMDGEDMIIMSKFL